VMDATLARLALSPSPVPADKKQAPACEKKTPTCEKNAPAGFKKYGKLLWKRGVDTGKIYGKRIWRDRTGFVLWQSKEPPHQWLLCDIIRRHLQWNSYRNAILKQEHDVFKKRMEYESARMAAWGMRMEEEEEGSNIGEVAEEEWHNGPVRKRRIEEELRRIQSVALTKKVHELTSAMVCR